MLARNDLGVQAFRLGRHLAVQFHPEVDGEQFRLWLDAGGRDGDRERPAWTRTGSSRRPSPRNPPPSRAGRLVASALRIAAYP